MNNLIKLVQYFSIIGAEEASEVASEVFTSYNLHMHKLESTAAVQCLIQECTDLYAVMELLVDAVSGVGVQEWAMSPKEYLSYMFLNGPFAEELATMQRGAELATTKTDLYLSLVQELTYLAKAFSKMARFGVYSENPSTKRTAWLEVIYRYLLVESLLRVLFDEADFRPDSNRVELKKGKILSHMRDTFKAGLL